MTKNEKSPRVALWAPEQSVFDRSGARLSTAPYKVEAWNLTWVSIPVEDRVPLPTSRADFRDALRDTLRSELDCPAGRYRMEILMRLPPQSFQALVMQATNAEAMPLVRLLGSQVLNNWRSRPGLSTLQHPVTLNRMIDDPALDVTAARLILRRFAAPA